MPYKNIDELSRVVGVMECFNEMLASGVKKLALGEPVYDKQIRDAHIEYAKEICKKYKTQYYIEDEGFVSDLFPLSMSSRKYYIVFYKEANYLEKYFELKEIKSNLVKLKTYDDQARSKLAYDFGKLLSYSDTDIERMIQENNEKEIYTEIETKIKVGSQITFLYFDEIKKAVSFFVDVFGFEVEVAQKEDYCIILKTSPSSYLGIVNRKTGSMKATGRDGVLVTFVVEDTERVYQIVKSKNVNELTILSVRNDIKIKGFMFTGPEGYRFEVQEFLP